MGTLRPVGTGYGNGGGGGGYGGYGGNGGGGGGYGDGTVNNGRRRR